MTTDDQTRDEKLQYDIVRSYSQKLQKSQPYHQVKLISMIILQVKKYCFLIKNK